MAAVKPMVSPTLVGRRDELAALVSAVAAAPAVVCVEGEAGVGKTRLVAELLDRAELAGQVMLAGRCHQIRESFPLGPIVEALRGTGSRLAQLHLTPAAGALRPLLPELAGVLPAQPDPLDDPAGERHRVLSAISADSATDAWAVGHFSNPSTGISDNSLALHWNGTSWTKTTTPSPGGDSGFTLLSGVTAISPANAWAVGYSATSLSSGTGQPLVLHWNGTNWQQVASPSPGGTASLTFPVSVHAISADNVWAVGYYSTAGGQDSLILHWTGTAWQRPTTSTAGRSCCTGPARAGSRSPAPTRAEPRTPPPCPGSAPTPRPTPGPPAPLHRRWRHRLGAPALERHQVGDDHQPQLTRSRTVHPSPAVQGRARGVSLTSRFLSSHRLHSPVMGSAPAAGDMCLADEIGPRPAGSGGTGRTGRERDMIMTATDTGRHSPMAVAAEPLSDLPRRRRQLERLWVGQVTQVTGLSLAFQDATAHPGAGTLELAEAHVARLQRLLTQMASAHRELAEIEAALRRVDDAEATELVEGPDNRMSQPSLCPL
jgi:AAA ATPase-like protein